jgi:hypothetical protein
MAGLLGLLSDAAELTSKTAKVAPKVAKAGEVMSIPADIAAQFVKAADPAHIRGAEVMDMLKSGRGSEVTDQMLDMGDPVLNARLNEYLYKNADIPMDAASRMARAGEMGFDVGTPLYRGSNVDLADYGRNISSAEGGDGVTFLTDEKSTANTYARPRYRGDTGQNVAPALIRSSKFNEAGYTKPFPDNGTEAQINAWMSGMENFNRRLDPENAKSNYFNSEIERARAMGRDGVVIRQVEDDKINTFNTMPSNVYASFNPANIRSRFARFDPRLSHLKNLSASVGAGLLGANMMPNNDGSR